MGKGKKKGGQGAKSKGDETISTTLQSLSISEEPSTSQTELVATEEGTGLTGGSKRIKPKNKEDDPPIPVDKSIEAAATTPSDSVSVQTPIPQTESEVTEEFVGLTGGTKRTKPKKKQQAIISVSTETTIPPDTSISTPSAIQSPSEQTVEEKEEESFGLGLGPSKKRPKKKKNVPAAIIAEDIQVTQKTTQAETSLQPQVAQQPIQVQTSEQLQPNLTAPPSFEARNVGFGRGSGVCTKPLTQSAPLTESTSIRGPSTSSPWSRTTHATPISQPISSAAMGPSTSAPKAAEPVYTVIPSTMKSQAATPRSSDMALCKFQIPKKIIGNSVRSRPVRILANYLPMTIKPHKIYRYDISFSPDRPKKMLPKAFMISKEKHFKNIVMAFDQMKNCYTLAALPKINQNERFVTNVEFVDANGKPMRFEVSYKFTGMVDLGTLLTYMQSGGTSLSPPTEAIQCIDVILRQGTLESYVKAGRQFFMRPSNPIDLGDGLEIWTGLFQSGIFTSKAYINIDVAHKGFPKCQPLVQALIKDFKLDPKKSIESQPLWATEKFQFFLKGLKVVATVGGDNTVKGQKREFVCNGLARPANEETFLFQDQKTNAKKRMTVAEYFAKEKKVRLNYPNLNCMWVGPREKSIYYPMELLEIQYGQVNNKQLNDNQLATMVRMAATPPDIRKRKIEEVIRDMNYSRSPTFKHFGLDISNEFYPVNAKVLAPPKLEIGNGQVTEPKRGQWQANGVYRPETLQSWGFIAIECDQNRSDFPGIIKMMMNVGSQMGMRVSPPAMTRFDVKMRELQNVLFTALEKEIKFLFIIVSFRGRDYYHRVKQLAERDVGILTQCIKEQTAQQRMNQQTVKNIFLKVNAKLMGINQALDVRNLPRCLKDGGVMVVGADVTHPSPDQSNIPSIAAVTASIDVKCTLYNIELSVQTPKKEMIVEFEEMMVDHLQVYRKHQRALPQKIFVFRDGVSEGQFAQVMNSELQAVHNAYKTVAGHDKRPEVLFLLVQKRHHTRLFIPNSNQNVEPGTVVDTDIVHASELDFYLVSHQALKGTARPTRYHAVCNDGKIPHDEVEQLTYYLCHLYSRCMRAVSYPTPTYYAHLACLRARSLTYGEKFDNCALERKPVRLRVMDKILQYSRMFFV